MPQLCIYINVFLYMDRRCTLELGVVAAICKHTYQKIFRGDYIISTIHNNKSLEHGGGGCPKYVTPCSVPGFSGQNT
jgi:hypothetical protein